MSEKETESAPEREPEPKLREPPVFGRVVVGPWERPARLTAVVNTLEILMMTAAFVLGLLVGQALESSPARALRERRAERAAEEAYQAALADR